MRPESARRTANLILAAAGIVAAYLVLTRPPLRRFALGVARHWLGGSLPAYLATEARRAWMESARSG
jgi:hypothetical protein